MSIRSSEPDLNPLVILGRGCGHTGMHGNVWRGPKPAKREMIKSVRGDGFVLQTGHRAHDVTIICCHGPGVPGCRHGILKRMRPEVPERPGTIPPIGDARFDEQYAKVREPRAGETRGQAQTGKSRAKNCDIVIALGVHARAPGTPRIARGSAGVVVPVRVCGMRHPAISISLRGMGTA